jgi:regulator of sigma E protease
VRIVRFSIGFGRPLWSRVDRHGTEFVIAAIPLGGYVRMLDEQEPGEVTMAVPRRADDVAHWQLPVWWRIVIAAAGPVANFLLAIVVYWVLFVAGSTSYAPVLGPAPADSPLAKAGVPARVEIVAVDGAATADWQQVNTALAARLGDTGDVVLTTRAPGSEDTESWQVPIRHWHQGEADPDLLGSLGIKPQVPAIIAQVLPDGPAAEQGSLRPWDTVEAVNGAPIEDWFDWVDVVRNAPGKPLEVEIDRGGQRLDVQVTPGVQQADDGSEYGFLGLAAMSNQVKFGPLAAIGRSIAETWDKSALTLGFLKKMLTGDVSVKNLSSPIMIAKVAGDTARASWQMYLGLLALLSISLGILNLLPIPILDGGHIVYGLVEVVRGRPVSERTQIIGAQIGLVLVAGMVLIAVYNDIMRLL